MQILLCLVVALLGDHVMCQQLEDDRSLAASVRTALRTVCEPYTQPASTSCARCESIAGKLGPKGEAGVAGPKGSPGDVGSPGPAGVVDQSLFDNQQSRFDTQQTLLENHKTRLDTQQAFLDTKQSEITALKNKVKTLEGTIDEINRKLAIQECRRNGIYYDNRCFFVLDRKRNFNDGQRACAKANGHLAYIDTPAVYEAVKPILLRKLAASGSSFIDFHIGATYNPNGLSRQITLLDGRTVTWSHKWHSCCPRVGGGYTSMGWQVRSSSSSSEGLYNYEASYIAHQICQKDI